MIPLLVPYILLASGLAGALLLFCTLKDEIRKLALKNRRRMDELARSLDPEPARDLEPLYTPVPARAGMNAGKRVQAMRMFRRNEDVSRIAQVLGVARQEVELLIRVHRMSPQITRDGNPEQN